MISHNWTFEEDLLCCKQYLKFYYSNDLDKSLVSLIRNLSLKMPKISSGSIRMKINNIRYLMHKYGLIKETNSLLENYSLQCQAAFYQAIKDLNEEFE